jgi:hypothetical protein
MSLIDIGAVPESGRLVVIALRHGRQRKNPKRKIVRESIRVCFKFDTHLTGYCLAT